MTITRHSTLVALCFIMTPLVTFFSGCNILLAKPADSESPIEVMARLQQTYDNISSLKFTFSQTSEGQLSGRPRKGRGEAVFLKDGLSGKMRWDYQGKEAQVIINNGEEFLMYFAKLKQMIIMPTASMQENIMYSFFSGKGKLKDSFYAAPGDSTTLFSRLPDNQPFQVLKLVPMETQSQLSFVHLYITSDSMIRRIEITDHFDTLTTIDLDNLQIDTLTSLEREALNKLFLFSPPQGTEIIHQ